MTLTLEAAILTHPPKRRRATVPRQDVQAARQAAEQYYQALRRWETVAGEPITYSSGSSSAARFQVVGIGNWRTGGGGSFKVTDSLLRIAGMLVREGAVGLIVLDLLNSRDHDEEISGNMLARIQTGAGPQSLIDERGGWAFPRGRNILYGVAVLTLMERLGVSSALPYRLILQSQLSKSQD